MHSPSFRRLPVMGVTSLLTRHAAPYTSSARTTTSSARIVRHSHDSKRDATPPEYLPFSSPNEIENIVEKGGSAAYPAQSSPLGICEVSYLGLDIEGDGNSSTRFDRRFSATSATVCDSGENEIMDFSKAKARLAFYTSLLGSRALRSSPSTVPSLSADELREVRNVLDCIIQSDDPHRNHCVLDSFRVAYHFGFPKRCCELYTSVARDALRGGGNVESRAPVPEAILMSEIVLAAAAATMDLETLGLCTSVVEQMASSDCASFRKSFEASAPTIVPALRLYWCLVLLLRDHQFTPKRTAPVVPTGKEVLHDASIPTEMDVAQQLHAPLTALSTRVAAVLGVVEKNRLAFLTSSVRLALYNVDAADGQAAVYHQVFRHWCLQPVKEPRGQQMKAHHGRTPIKGGYSLSSWLTPPCLNELMRSAIHAKRRDMAEVYSLHIDLFWRHQARPPLTQHGSSAVFNTEKSLDYYEDALVGGMMRYFLFSRQTRRAVLWMQRLTIQFPGYVPSIQVCNVIGRVAAAERNVSLSQWCLGHLLNEKQPIPPTSAELYSCLCANARVGIPNFDQVLYSLQENQLLQLTEEELLHLRLLHCRGSTQWRNIPKMILQTSMSKASLNRGDSDTDLAPGPTRVSTTNDDYESLSIPCILDGHFEHLEKNPRSVLSIRNLDQLLLVLQESEHPHFLVYYRFFLSHYMNLLKLEKRAQWAGLALVWASTRVDRMSKEDILYIAWEVAQLLGSKRADDLKDSRAVNEILGGILPSTKKSLRRKWERVCAHFPQAWWRRQLGTKMRQKRHQLLRNPRLHDDSTKKGVDALPIDESMLKSVIHTYESSPLPFAGFLKYPTHGLCTCLPSTGLFDSVTLSILHTGDPCDRMGRSSYYSLASKREWWRFHHST
ncbi:unnamed protein product [Phytomonas sp. EM1]|nr:unnamed protein product [Phytomonas sp. EM1]|eukprot:CCW59693.1 unnamed protein product [Phytomonas sp. isolate EM1]